LKYLFYVLIVINLVFFTWRFGLQQGESFLGDDADQHLELPEDALGPEPGSEMDEYADSHVPSEEATGPIFLEPPSVPRAASAKGCFEIGPLQSRETAEGFMTLLAPSARDIRLVIRPGDVPEGWWVIYPKASTLEAAHANRRMLEGKGIFDSWLFDKGPLAGALSLGLYKTREEADQALQILLAKGIGAKVAPRLVRGEVFWLKIPWTGLPLALEETVQVLNSQDPTLAMPLPVVCNK
jgi:hypothetical protein